MDSIQQNPTTIVSLRDEENFLRNSHTIYAIPANFLEEESDSSK